MLPIPVKAQLNSQLLVQNESFLSPQFEATDQNQYQFLGIKILNGLDDDILYFDSEAVMAMGAPTLSYIKVKEAAIQFKSSDTEVLILGRKKKTFSSLDERWVLGVVEPTFKWNPLNRDNLGLTGAFWSVEKNSLQFTAFWSPLYIPDQGPSFDVGSDGQFKRVNPWFQMPPKSFRPFPESTADSKINYSVHRPPESELIFQSSFGGSLEGMIDDKILWRASHFYKPMNQLALGYNGVYVLSEREGDVTVIPEVGYHNVTTADLVIRSGIFEYGLMAMQDKPSDVKFESDWTAPQFEQAFLYGGYAQMNWRRQSVSVEVMNIEGGRVREEGDLASSDRAPISSRYPFYQAYRVRHSFRIPFGLRERLSAETSWTHSDQNQFDLIQVKGRFEFAKRWQAYTDMQFVRAHPSDAKNQNEISSYENNDRLMVGMAYEL